MHNHKIKEFRKMDVCDVSIKKCIPCRFECHIHERMHAMYAYAEAPMQCTNLYI